MYRYTLQEYLSGFVQSLILRTFEMSRYFYAKHVEKKFKCIFTTYIIYIIGQAGAFFVLSVSTVWISYVYGLNRSKYEVYVKIIYILQWMICDTSGIKVKVRSRVASPCVVEVGLSLISMRISLPSFNFIRIRLYPLANFQFRFSDYKGDLLASISRQWA